MTPLNVLAFFAGASSAIGVFLLAALALNAIKRRPRPPQIECDPHPGRPTVPAQSELPGFYFDNKAHRPPGA